MMRGFFVLLVLALAGSHCAVVWAQEYTPIAPTEITGPTPHTVQLRWRAITGTARAIATNRRLFAAEF